MKTKVSKEDKGFQSEIDSTNVNEVVNGLVNDCLPVLATVGENDADFVLPESLEIGAPTNITSPEKNPGVKDSGCKVLSLTPNRMTNALQVVIQLIEPHPLVMKVHKEKDLRGLKLTMRLKGLLEPIKVVNRDGKYLITDGISRYFAAVELGWETLPVIVVELTDEEIQEQYVYRNFRTKRSIEELTNHAEVILGVLGLSQGKKRERIGGLELGEENYSLAGKDRFEIACEVLGIDMSPSSLRRLMQVREFVKSGDEEVKKLNLIDRLDRGEMKINQAFNVVENYKNCKKEQGSNELIETLKVVQGKNYKLFNKTCEDLSDLDDESVDAAIDSQVYYQQKDYERDEVIDNQMGLEDTVDEYIERQVNIRLGLYPKLKKSGSLFIVIADSYDKGVDCLVVEKFIIKMVESGWNFIQKWYWVKDNPKPQSNIKRLLPNYEYCLHFVKDVKAYRWREFVNWKEGGFKVVKGSNERELSKKRDSHSWSLQKPIERFRSFLSEQHVSRVLETNGFRWSELADIDPGYRHQAPYPSVIPLLPMLLTTKVGDTVLDIYNGTSTTTAVALQLGRKAIGYDIDKVNHAFAAKRLQMVEQNLPDVNEVLALEAEFLCNRESFDSNSFKAVA